MSDLSTERLLQLMDARAEIGRLRNALQFYARPAAYQGSNQPNERAIQDVTRDGGAVARAALTGGSGETAA